MVVSREGLGEVERMQERRWREERERGVAKGEDVEDPFPSQFKIFSFLFKPKKDTKRAAPISAINCRSKGPD